jgi:hypothetical protein
MVLQEAVIFSEIVGKTVCMTFLFPRSDLRYRPGKGKFALAVGTEGQTTNAKTMFASL